MDNCYRRNSLPFCVNSFSNITAVFCFCSDNCPCSPDLRGSGSLGGRWGRSRVLSGRKVVSRCAEKEVRASSPMPFDLLFRSSGSADKKWDKILFYWQTKEQPGLLLWSELHCDSRTRGAVRLSRVNRSRESRSSPRV